MSLFFISDTKQWTDATLTPLAECSSLGRDRILKGSQIFDNAISPFVVESLMVQGYRQNDAPIPIEAPACTWAL